MKWIFYLGISSSIFCRCYSQEIPYNKAFLDHLLKENLKGDIGLYAGKMLQSGSLDRSLADSLHFMLGKLYLDEQRDSSIYHLRQVSPYSNGLQIRSRKYLLYQYAWKGQFPEARNALGKPMEVIADTCGYRYLNFALSVLDRENKSMAKGLSCGEFSQALNLQKIDNTLTKMERKSPFKAALLSTLVPGLGKVYAGRPGQGLMVLLSNSIFALQAWEGYDKGGLSDPRFIIFSSLFTVFYFGNIWGSALSVKVNYRQQYDEYKAAILATFEWAPGFKSNKP